MKRISGSGPLSATICFVGEAPDVEEEKAGHPFVGAAGVELKDQWIHAAGIDPDSVRYEHVCEVRPEGGKFNRIPPYDSPTKSDMDVSDGVLFDSGAGGWLSNLRDRLNTLPNLRVVCAVGAWPARLLTGRISIASTKHRGSCYRITIGNRDVTLVCMVAPQWMLDKRLWSVRLLALNDVIKARRITAGLDWEDRQPILAVPNDYAGARHALTRLKYLCELYPTNPLAFDTETLGQSIDTISFGINSPIYKDRYEAVAVGFQGVDGPLYPYEVEMSLWVLIAEILGLSNPKVIQNGQYDLRFLSDMGIGVRNIWWDTKYASHALHPGIGDSVGPIKPRALDTLVSLYTYLPYYKDERVGFGGIPVDKRWEYAARDAAATLMVADGQLAAMSHDTQLRDMFLGVSMPQLVPYHRMEVEGVGVNKTVLKRRKEEIQREFEPLKRRLTRLRYGTSGIDDWRGRVESLRQRIAETETNLADGKILDACKSCDGAGGRVSVRGTKNIRLVYNECRNCRGAGEHPTKNGKRLLRNLTTELTRLIKNEPTFNVNSQVQLIDWLFTSKKEGGLGFRGKPNRTSKTGKPSTDGEAIQGLLLKMAKDDARWDILTTIIKIRELGTELSNFVDIGLSADGRFRTQCQPLEATGRVASREDSYGDGRNFQNFPRKGAAKEAIIPPADHVIVGFDYKQIEALVVAWDAGDADFIEAVQGGQRDVHSEATELAFGILQSDYSREEWRSVWRQAGKRVRHGFNYGMGVRTMRAQLLTDIPGFSLAERECTDALHRLAIACPLEEHRKAEILMQVQTTRRMTTPFGRVIKYYQPWDSQIGKAALAYRPQSTAGDILNRGLVKFHTYWHEVDPQVKVMATIHDAVKWSCPSHMVDATLQIALQCWGEPLISVDSDEHRLKGALVCPMEFSTGPNFNEQEELDEFNNSIQWAHIQSEIAKVA